MARAKALKSSHLSERRNEYSSREAAERFERAVDIAVATKPMHKPKKKRGRKR